MSVGRLRHIAVASELGERESDEPASVLEAHFSTLMRETKLVVFRVACGVLRDTGDAEEIAQDAFLQAYENLRCLREPAKFRAWVCRIAFRLALNRRRAQGRRLARDAEWYESRGQQGVDGERAEAEREYLALLRNEIERLPGKLRTVVLLASVAGMDACDVAAMLEIPYGTVRRRLHEARKRLIEVMGR